jgi:hypothetical protein
MSGFITVEDKDGNYRVYETPGETWVEIATEGHPDKLAFGELSIVTASWAAEQPEPKGKTIEEAAAEEEAKAAKEAEKATAEPAKK